jgi:SAM-dependent methyltransferase
VEDDIARQNQQHWDRLVRQGVTYTRPWLDLDVAAVRAFGDGTLDVLPEPYTYVYPQCVFRDVSGKEVLCLASGGGQQSAVFGLLGTPVTVFDLTGGQLDGDRKAARHCGYDVRLVQGDMRDLSGFADSTFDIVYQAISVCLVPGVRDVYSQVARVLRPGGIYRVGHCNPATQIVEETSWDGEAYRIRHAYGGGQIEDDEVSEFRHLLSDIFNGLVETGFVIRGVWEDPRHLKPETVVEPGTYDHMLGFVQKYFAIVAEKAR